jgi:hypothetical protein
MVNCSVCGTPLEHRDEPCPNCLPGMAWRPPTYDIPKQREPEPPWEELQEIDLLKRTVKALSKMCLHYRIGKPTMPEWVFDNIAEAKARYGEDLTKII